MNAVPVPGVRGACWLHRLPAEVRRILRPLPRSAPSLNGKYDTSLDGLWHAVQSLRSLLVKAETFELSQHIYKTQELLWPCRVWLVSYRLPPDAATFRDLRDLPFNRALCSVGLPGLNSSVTPCRTELSSGSCTKQEAPFAWSSASLRLQVGGQVLRPQFLQACASESHFATSKWKAQFKFRMLYSLHAWGVSSGVPIS